uniref:SKI/SNO/DAC domain-containing protein n=1 Tax=Hucho hucho TaxID=62062 RepID=A0A4W5PWD3_9TELE
MAVSATHPVLSPDPGEPSSGGIFHSDPFYTPTTTRVPSCVKIASFSVGGQDELICLPQVFDLFLKHLVGGLHTVYTKLKRLDICPVVCTVEQVRVLRGLGAIQPGVNRCKLISRRDFEALYNDCTDARLVQLRKKHFVNVMQPCVT